MPMQCIMFVSPFVHVSLVSLSIVVASVCRASGSGADY